MVDLRLPSDLASFLKAGQQLKYDRRAAEPGRITLLSIEDLRLEEFRVRSDGKEQAARDPHRGERGFYLVPAVNLTASAEGYWAKGILLWIPAEDSFGTWDSDHADVWTFPEVTWSEIAADPLPFVNSQWYADATELEWLVPWPRYRFVGDGDDQAAMITV
jgi:hypothetical protein